ncbi:MAG: hypothetical protein Q8P49_00605 [Candidatus Liptonbacteria bacterium]|nr:hypothetical protein [Candidatus Liptonbacteria bacterium]
MSKQCLTQLLIVSAILIAAVAAILSLFPKSGPNSGLDAFAKCLASKNVTMYGADWCQHCENEKRRFGESFQFVPYVECPKEPGRCLAAGVKVYPTWIFSDPSASFPQSDSGQAGQVGKKLEGDQDLEKLSAESGCALLSSQP